MKIEIDTDFALPLIVGLIAIIFTIGHQTLVPKSTIDELVFENDKIFQELVVVTKEKDELYHQLEGYRSTETQITKLGATPQQAMWVMAAAKESSISWKVLAALIYSESEFKECRHANPDWIGLAGINAPVWKGECPYNPYSDKGNIYAAAWILKVYLDESKGDYLTALTHYKGFSPLGKRYAKHVLDIRYKYFN